MHCHAAQLLLCQLSSSPLHPLHHLLTSHVQQLGKTLQEGFPHEQRRRKQEGLISPHRLTRAVGQLVCLTEELLPRLPAQPLQQQQFPEFPAMLPEEKPLWLTEECLPRPLAQRPLQDQEGQQLLKASPAPPLASQQCHHALSPCSPPPRLAVRVRLQAAASAAAAAVDPTADVILSAVQSTLGLQRSLTRGEM